MRKMLLLGIAAAGLLFVGTATTARADGWYGGRRHHGHHHHYGRRGRFDRGYGYGFGRYRGRGYCPRSSYRYYGGRRRSGFYLRGRNFGFGYFR